jgi:hypothetical protein
MFDDFYGNSGEYIQRQTIQPTRNGWLVMFDARGKRDDYVFTNWDDVIAHVTKNIPVIEEAKKEETKAD